MELSSIVQTLLNGILLGGIYATVALAVSLIWGIVKVVHIGYGAMCMLAAYLTYWLYMGYGVEPFASLILTIPIFFVLSCIIQGVLIRPIFKKTGQFDIGLVSLIILFGVAIFLEGLMLGLWTSDPRAISITYFGASQIWIGSIAVSVVKLLTFITGIICFLFVYLFMQRTRLGKAIRAVSQNKDAAALMGVNTNYAYMLAFGITGILAAVTGMMISILFTVWASGYWTWIVKSFMIVALGGVGSVFGTLIAALILGTIESMTGLVFRFVYSQVIGVIILVLIIYIRPGVGLFGKKEVSGS